MSTWTKGKKAKVSGTHLTAVSTQKHTTTPLKATSGYNRGVLGLSIFSRSRGEGKVDKEVQTYSTKEKHAASNSNSTPFPTFKFLNKLRRREVRARVPGGGTKAERYRGWAGRGSAPLGRARRVEVYGLGRK